MTNAERPNTDNSVGNETVDPRFASYAIGSEYPVDKKNPPGVRIAIGKEAIEAMQAFIDKK